LYVIIKKNKRYLDNNKKLDGYVPPFSTVSKCTYENTDLCSLKGEKCPAPIQCYKEEIEDGNKHNGSKDPNNYVDKAITDKSERKVDTKKSAVSEIVKGKTIYYVVGIIILVIICCCCCCCCCADDSSNSKSTALTTTNSYARDRDSVDSGSGGVLVIRRTITRVITGTISS